MKVYGRSVCIEALYSNYKINVFYMSNDLKNKEENIINLIKDKKIKLEFLSKDKMDKMFINNQGFICDVSDYKYYELEDVIDNNKRQNFIILDGLTDPQNLGAILRVAEATQIDGIIIPKNNSVSINHTVAKVSTGAIWYVNIIQVNNINTTIDLLKKNNFWIIGTEMNASKSYKDIDNSTSLAVVIGSEGKGIRRLTKEKCDYLVSIPMFGKINSLNASFSAGLLMYEMIKK